MLSAHENAAALLVQYPAIIHYHLYKKSKTIFLYKWQRMSMEQATLTVECCPIFDDSFTGEYYSAYINWIIIINACNLYEHTDNSPVHFGQ